MVSPAAAGDINRFNLLRIGVVKVSGSLEGDNLLKVGWYLSFVGSLKGTRRQRSGQMGQNIKKTKKHCKYHKAG